MARKRYSDQLSEVKRKLKDNPNMERPFLMFPDFWEAVQVYWAREDVKKKSTQNSRNRLSEPDGPGTRISKHTGGSRSTRILQQALSKQTGRPKEALNYETFTRIHKSNKDGSYITRKDEKLDGEVRRIAAETGRDSNDVYLELTSPHKSQCYGIGSAGSSQLTGRSTRSTGSSASLVTRELLQTRIDNLEEQLAAEREAREALEQQHRQDREALEQQRRQDREVQELQQQQMLQQMAELQRMFSSGQWRPPRTPP